MSNDILLPHLTSLKTKAPVSLNYRGLLDFFVGVAGFEPTTSTSQMWRDTGLRYTPMVVSPFLLAIALALKRGCKDKEL